MNSIDKSLVIEHQLKFHFNKSFLINILLYFCQVNKTLFRNDVNSFLSSPLFQVLDCYQDP